MTVEIWHNPRCSKSRETLKLLEENNITTDVFLYLEQHPSAQLIAEVLNKLKLSARDLLRKSEDAYKAQNLKDKDLSDQQLIDAMVNEPKLIQRPIVINGKKARLGRPPEQVLEIL
ncbi:arsenate reductase (glutaredoxin) [Bermanella sp. 47_1433_sub80_T6]|nr:arsenate reductase (glutaredoxin) [Bermanella sp. 47_1433_sub80_T6]